MSVYTVHQPPFDRKGRRPGVERFAFVRDGFHFWAFLITPIWMLWHRMWLVLLGYIGVMALMHGTLWYVRAGDGASFALNVLLSLLIGLEAGTLRRWTLRRWQHVATMVGDDREGAERRFYAYWADGGAARSLTVPAPVVHAAGAPGDVIGSFPEPGNAR